MRWLADLVLGMRLLLRNWHAGELQVLAIAVVIAVASVTTVGFFADRVEQALVRQANQLLGADLVIVSDRPFDPNWRAAATDFELVSTEMLRFPSMVSYRSDSVLVDVKVVSAGYPLRGELRIADQLHTVDRLAAAIPKPGTVWVDEKLLTRLNVSIGSKIELGRIQLKVAAMITQEPDSAVGFIMGGPRLMLNQADLLKTGLDQIGSRIRYRLQFSGQSTAIAAYQAWLVQKLIPGQRIESIQDARPEIRSALERSAQFLNLTALLSVILAAVAIALAARRFLQRQLDACAVMRCMGTARQQLLRIYGVQFICLGLMANGVGCLIGAIAQQGLAFWLSHFVGVELPEVRWLPAIQGYVIGFFLLIGFAMPPLLALGQVSPLRVLRREFIAPKGNAAFAYLLGLATIGVLMIWKAGDIRLGSLVFVGFVVAMLILFGLVWVVIGLLSRLPSVGVSWRFGLGQLSRHRWSSVVQIVALSIGLMALLTLTLIRGELLQIWQSGLPVDAPNRFVVNIQEDQLVLIKAFFKKHQVDEPEMHPMVRGRLIKINHREIKSADYSDDRARRLVDREFNLSWAESLQKGNQLIQGDWWRQGSDIENQWSVESGVARALNLKIGDELSFDIAGQVISGNISNLRKVDWDSFRVNFFIVSPPGQLNKLPVSYVTSFYVPPEKVELLNALVREFPNVLLIDVGQVMVQVRGMIAQVSSALQFVFLFTLISGMIVLYAALASTQDERLYQASIMRVIGASRSQVMRAGFSEFIFIGAFSGLLAAVLAQALGYTLALKFLNVDYGFSVTVWFVGVIGGGVGAVAVGYLGLQHMMRISPIRIMRQYY